MIFVILREILLFMVQKQYVFNQLMQFIPKDYFEWLVRKYRGNTGLKGYSCWNHLLVMIWAQLKSQKSLREIETSLRAHSDTSRASLRSRLSEAEVLLRNRLRQ